MSQLNLQTLQAVREEVTSSYSHGEIETLQSFEAFFDLVDVANAFEDEWEEKKETYRPYYQRVWGELVTGGISL